jgi:Tol biopolymer transport system component
LFVWSGADGLQDDIYLRAVDAADTPPRRITNDPNQEFSPVWSPDGKSIAWRRRSLDAGDGELWVASVKGVDVGPPRVAARVADDGGFFGLAWWPDSASLVVRDRGSNGYPLVRVHLTDGSKDFLPGEPDQQDYQPVLSPDRKRLLFFRFSSTNPQLCALELSTSNPKPACRPIKEELRAATWTLDSRSILLSGAQALWLVHPLSSDPPARLLDGLFSGLTTDSAGGRYAFNRTITDVNIWKFDVATQQATQFLSSSEEESEPHFSPDGRKILFRSSRTGHFELYVCNSDGSDLRQLTNLQGHVGSARWSPDGRWMAYDSSQRSPGPAGITKFDNIYVMPAEGGAARCLTNNDAGHVVPGWSADSRWVYYTRGKRREAWKVPAQGGAPVKLGDREMWDTTESPDGKWLWYERPATGKDLWRRLVYGGDEERIAGTGEMAYRAWDPRGYTLYFLRNGPGAGFFQLSLDPGRKASAKRLGPPPRRLLHGPRTMTASPDGKTLLYTSEDLTAGDIYVLTPDPKAID